MLPSADGRLGTSRFRYSFIDVDNTVIPRNGAVREVKTESPVKTNERFAFAASTFGPGPGDFLLDSIEPKARSYLSKQLAAPLIKG
jgi:hypothetical protein